MPTFPPSLTSYPFHALHFNFVPSHSVLPFCIISSLSCILCRLLCHFLTTIRGFPSPPCFFFLLLFESFFLSFLFLFFLQHFTSFQLSPVFVCHLCLVPSVFSIFFLFFPSFHLSFFPSVFMSFLLSSG